ncbi:XK-related protein 8-like [Chanos chanos]|uniref:XK-related protein n=1 Tax=Chanos chanos TaxID=29144 RepID=A0A6J2WFM6_CHACN|nr:XK-related protein 8-like [Chanos chanos]
MEEDFPFKYSVVDVLLQIVGLILFVSDLVLDVWAICSLYIDGAYISMGLFIFLLLGSSVLVHVFSWIWYSDGEEYQQTTVDKFVKKHSLLKPVHVLQLGVFLRYTSILEISIFYLRRRTPLFKKVAVHLTHDLLMLRLFETFSKNAPQLTFMITIIFVREELQLFTAVKAIASAVAVAFSVLMYHRAMRESLSDKIKKSCCSSVFFFFWNLLLIGPRITAVALFASVLPVFVVAHFLTLWMPFVLWAWRQRTDFMDSPGGEWLYRATVGLIWYFDWFNVSKGNTKRRSIIYHGIMLLDSGLLIGLWWWIRVSDTSCRGPFPINPYVLVSGNIFLYIAGLALKAVYYKCCHPKLNKPAQVEAENACMQMSMDEPNSSSPQPQPVSGAKKRRRNLVTTFYS